MNGRLLSKPLSLLIAVGMMVAWVAEVMPVGHTLTSNFWPAPPTIIMREEPE